MMAQSSRDNADVRNDTRSADRGRVPGRDEGMRSCRRTGCRWPASASLSYRYDTRQVWLLDLAEPDPSFYDLCPHHADTLTVPRGWECVDHRTQKPAMVELPASERVATASETPRPAERVAVGARVPRASAPIVERSSRYAALTAKLPALAAEHGEQGDHGAAVGGETSGEEASGAPVEAEPVEDRTISKPRSDRPSGARAPAPVPSRELAPMPSDPIEGPAGGALLEDPSAAEQQLAGQLPLPTIEAEPESDPAVAGGGDAVVLSLEFAGGRRRSDTDVSSLESQ